MPRALLAAALAACVLAVSMPQPRAATGPDPHANVQCESLTSDTMDAAAAGIVFVVYKGAEAARFVAAAESLLGPAPLDLSQTTFVATFLPNVEGSSAFISFYDAEPAGDCAFFAISFKISTLSQIIKQMLAGSI